ncbi:MAG: nitroreductase [Desulfomonile tiedjei]|uniref:Nitroreductase n=1 Tax=Desulfomonile tiedjei TaxID=2358 RepID=A0A9D6V425_9BACT|nr:nitroreductase [Desulfomonile tiedjei]
MEFNDAVLGRKSTRAFLPDPVPRETITRIVDVARWAPSWGNTQPWEIVIADGPKCKTLADLFEEEGRKGVAPRPDIDMPLGFHGDHKRRYMELGRELLTFMGIEREDKEARIRHYLNMYRFFEAPCVVYFTIDGGLNVPYSCLDVGSIATTFCCAAVQEGLGTIYLAASMHFPDIVRKVLEIPADKKIVIGVALGYPHPDAPAARFRSDREQVEAIMRFA